MVRDSEYELYLGFKNFLIRETSVSKALYPQDRVEKYIYILILLHVLQT